MQLNTKHFGVMDVDESRIIEFPKGIPGFEQVRKYILLGNGEEDSLFKWLQSVDRPELAFVVTNPFSIKKDYDIDIDDEVVEFLEIKALEDVMVFSIVVVPEDTSKMTMNLKAPIIINTKKKKGGQVVLDTDKYSVRHYVLEELRRQEVTTDVGPDKEKESVYNHK
ncbi:MAG: flagellar assembly protein FliW [Acetivibrionales bacterium]|jgi:flagellar assembly factor FliW